MGYYSGFKSYAEYRSFIDNLDEDTPEAIRNFYIDPGWEKYGRMKNAQEQQEVKENQPNKADQSNIVSRQGESGGQGTTSLSGDRRGSEIDREALALGYALGGALLGVATSKLGE